MKPETAAKTKYGVWGLISGAVIAMIIGFAWGGWTTSGTTQTMTKRGGFGESGGDLRCAIHEATEPRNETQGTRGSK
jgi:hypothetical protein